MAGTGACGEAAIREEGPTGQGGCEEGWGTIAKGRKLLRVSAPSVRIFEDPESAPDYIYLPRRVNQSAVGMTHNLPATFAVAFDVRASLSSLPIRGCPLVSFATGFPVAGLCCQAPQVSFVSVAHPWLPLPAATLKTVAGFQLRIPFPVFASGSVSGSRCALRCRDAQLTTPSTLFFRKISLPVFCKMRFSPGVCKGVERINCVEIWGELWIVWIRSDGGYKAACGSR